MVDSFTSIINIVLGRVKSEAIILSSQIVMEADHGTRI